MTPHQRQTLVDALGRIAQGGAVAEAAFRVVFDAFWGRFVARFIASGVPSGEAEDLASDALVKIARGLKDLRDPLALEKWAQVVARRTLLDHLRAARSVQAPPPLDGEAAEAAIAAAVDGSNGDPATQRCLALQLDRFCQDEPHRAGLLQGMAVDGWSLDEAAAALGRTPAATKEFLSQCRKALWRYLALCLA